MARLKLPEPFTRSLRKGRRVVIYVALALLTVATVSLVVSSGHWLRARRIDLTADKLYTLSPGTLKIVDGLQRPLRLTLYFSEHATRDLPKLRSYEQRVRDILQEIAARSHGRVQLSVIDPVPYSDDEASAEGAGLAPANGGSNGERVFFGLAGGAFPAGVEGEAAENVAPERSLAIPFFDPARESFLEYDIAKLLYELNQGSKPRIGVISSLPVEGNPVLGQQPWVALQQLDQLFDVKALDPGNLKQVGADIRVLLLIHPKNLPDDALYAIDQYVLRGGHLVVFVDPDAELDDTPGDPATGALPDHSSDLPRLFAAWGVRYDPHEVVLDRSHALSVELGGNSVSHPAMLWLDAQQLNHDDVVTASLQRLDLSSAGHFDLAPNAVARLVPLLQSSADAEAVPVQRVQQAGDNPSLLLQDYKPDNVNYVFAARLRGGFASAFPERARQPGHLARSAPGDEVILVADTDLLSDRLWVEPQTVLGQTMMRPFANNGDFLGNLVDNLSGSSALLSIRGRSTSQRPFTRVDALRSVADQKFLQKEQELERELAETRQRLEELQPGKGGTNAGNVGAEQRQEIEQFRQRQLAINKELRDVQHQLNAEIDALGARLKVINIVLVPALVALLGLLYGWRRARRNRRRR
ncbi:Gldg family protein [Rhodanobacter sp. DHB23]|uniref:GldG family protein n=1 Tax=Rhodanobacter sp. DHB23 TaxID=2775923 RepID=UPI001782053D|nr:Gldg family protein [Rhodanobacter sp. DHB23]MBD8871708.1 Gldg family protein [Rhodanobacter sp. DHB23]